MHCFGIVGEAGQLILGFAVDVAALARGSDEVTHHVAVMAHALSFAWKNLQAQAARSGLFKDLLFRIAHAREGVQILELLNHRARVRSSHATMVRAKV
jgi:hypothetical protein